MTALAVTERCWHDLDALDPEVAERVLLRFEERRGIDPESGEPMSGVGGPVRKLHADLAGGRSVRAVTWWDRHRDVCWLMAAGMHDRFYGYVADLDRRGLLRPSTTDLANFEADAPVRLMRRVVENARPALLKALSSPGHEVAVTENPPPRAYFRVEQDRLWVRLTLYGPNGVPITKKQIAAFLAAVFGRSRYEQVLLDPAQWDSVGFAGPIPDPAGWPPPPQV